MATAPNLKLIFKLIEQATSLGVVSEFLKTKNLPHSAGSWADMYSSRIEPAVNESKISIQELIDLLRDVEEYGQQHIFLYKTKPATAQALMDRARISSVLRTLNHQDLLVQPRMFEFPATPSFVDVRWNSAKQDLELVVKEVLTHESLEYESTVDDGDYQKRIYKRHRARAVNVMVLRRNGELELRISSRRGSSKYDEDLRAIKHRLKPIVELDSFVPIALAKAKTRLWNDRAALASKIRYSDLIFTNDEDISLRAYGNAMTVNVVGNKGATDSLDTFVSNDGYCDGSNIWFIKGTQTPARDIHLILQGAANEFAVPTQCTKADYEYVLSELKTLNS
jgi:hypothetical protein